MAKFFAFHEALQLYAEMKEKSLNCIADPCFYEALIACFGELERDKNKLLSSIQDLLAEAKSNGYVKPRVQTFNEILSAVNRGFHAPDISLCIFRVSCTYYEFGSSSD